MSVELYGIAADEHFHLSSWTAVIVFELTGAPFHPEVGETTAQMASHYAEVMRRQLSEGEFERVWRRETGNDPSPEDREAMEEFASALAKERRWRLWLVLSKRTRIWFSEEGKRIGVSEDTFEESFGPFMQLGGKKFVLGLLDGGDG